MADQPNKTENNSVADRPLVLVCDDDADARSIIIGALAYSDYELCEVCDGVEAQQFCRTRLPDVVVMDIMMPGLTGIEFVKWLRANQQSCYVPVLLLTALADVESKVRGLEDGADDYLTKPYHYKELQARVGALLRVKYLMELLQRRSEELRQLNVTLQETQAALVAKERELVATQLSGAAAHSLGQPITALLLQCELLERTVGGGIAPSAAADLARQLELMRRECRTLKRIVDSLHTLDPNSTVAYVGDTRILKVEPALAEKD